MNSDLQVLDIGNGKNFKYISFRNSSSEAKLCSLHINEINNVDVKFELLENINMMDKVIMNKNEYTL